MSVLLRFDGIKGVGEGERALRFFSQDIVESKTVSCSLDGYCTDVVLLADGTRDTLKLNYAEFGYRHGSVERAMYTTASSVRGVVGEFFMREGNAYWLTSTHLCYAPNATSSTGVPVSVDNGALKANQQDLAIDAVLFETPAGGDVQSGCDGSVVTLFPELASVETTWLSIADTGIYNSEPDGVDYRRIIAEIGVSCASNISSMQRDLTLYELDCTPYSSCRDYRNIPFRRAATSSVFINLITPGSYFLKTKLDPTLFNLPRLANSADAFYASLLKMSAITLAAAVVFVRSKKKTASSSWLFKNCVSIIKHKGALHPVDGATENVFEDRIVGAVAILGRLTVTVLRVSVLSQDGQNRVCVAEYVGVALSALHFTLRYNGLMHDDDEAPISKLGGSTAIVDSTAAVMVAFSEPPTMAVSSSSFDPTARMLVALLVSIIVVTRCAFSAACCGTLYPTFKVDCRYDYCFLLLYAGVTWCIQSAILGINVCDLFVTPAAYSMTRSIFGDANAMYSIRATLFLALTTSGLPRLMITSRHILSEKQHVD